MSLILSSKLIINFLNQDEGVPYKIPHSVDGTNHDEGTIQVAELPTQSMARLEKPPTIYISMYAVNGVRLIRLNQYLTKLNQQRLGSD